MRQRELVRGHAAQLVRSGIRTSAVRTPASGRSSSVPSSAETHRSSIVWLGAASAQPGGLDGHQRGVASRTIVIFSSSDRFASAAVSSWTTRSTASASRGLTGSPSSTPVTSA